MDTPRQPLSPEDVYAAIQASGYVSEIDWSKGIADAGRIGIERFIADNEIGRTQVSHGHLRLTGAGVTDNGAAASAVATVLSSFQRLVNAVGASLESGNTSLRGQISAAIAQRTRLRLIASPAPGSLVLNLSPESPPEAEAAPGGEAPMFAEQSPLADQALLEVVGMLFAASQLGADADGSVLLERIEGLGPRTGAAIRAFGQALADADFDTDVEWQVPTRAAARAAIKRNDALAVAQLVESRHLDSETFVIVGVIRTVSDLSAWVVDGEDGERYQIDAHDIPPDLANALHTQSRVRVETEMIPTRHVGGSFQYAYRARSIDILV